MSAVPVAQAFADPVLDAQAVFRALMCAMAAPAQAVPVTWRVSGAGALPAGLAACALALCDFETTLWLDDELAKDAAGSAFLRFHTGARLVPDPAEAAFALVANPVRLPRLARFAQGTLEYPDRSTTIIVKVDRLDGDDWAFEGPGISGVRRFGLPAPPDLPAQWMENGSRFPRGVDLVFVCDDAVAALPRSARLAA